MVSAEFSPGGFNLTQRARDDEELRLFVMGFSSVERQLLNGVAALLQRRMPPIDLVVERTGEHADVVMIDGGDPRAMQWAAGQVWGKGQAVIWVDVATVPSGHIQIKRPVQWSVLPMLLARALEPAAGPQQCDHESSATAQMPVLLATDSQAVRTYLRSMLEPRGFLVAEANCAETVLEFADRCHCILLDVGLHGGDGYETCRRIKALARTGHPGPAVVMLRNNSTPFDPVKAQVAGCDAHLTKPFNRENLRAVLTQYVANLAPGGVESARAPLTRSTTGAMAAAMV